MEYEEEHSILIKHTQQTLTAIDEWVSERGLKPSKQDTVYFTNTGKSSQL